jgi:hypothetical protein
VVLLALAVERGGCDRSRCYGDSNGGFHFAAGELKATEARADIEIK